MYYSDSLIFMHKAVSTNKSQFGWIHNHPNDHGIHAVHILHAMIYWLGLFYYSSGAKVNGQNIVEGYVGLQTRVCT